MRGTYCWTDHQMLRSKVALRIRQKHNRQGTSKPTKLDTAKLSTISHRKSFEQEMDSALAQSEVKENSTPDEEWAALQQIVYNTQSVHLKSRGGMETFSDSKIVMARWSEHFQKLHNVPGDIDHEALDNIPQRITKTSLDDIPTMDEIARAIAGLKDGKAPGGDGIPAEVWKHGRDNRQTAPTNHQCLGDDSALVAHSAEEMQKIVDAFSDASKEVRPED
ncbi:hypothetical protein NP493_532g03022 [Ridgeia piscesae]|uniref:Uncharacterized protein n=1 Tax=Ridgeia piscesae TaxID=27915 RepID=A0AAD9KXQ6_RIDPI|nr:hypothetical protein NP493_532g03022 [Ridgeia piscesae]